MSAILSLPETDPATNARRPAKLHAILAAAADLFMAEGYAAVSMDAVAKRAGVSKATLYAHMPSKEALFGEVVARRCSAMADEMDRVAVHDQPLPQAMRGLARFWLGFVLSPSSIGVYRTVIAEGARFPDLARAFFDAGPARGLAHIRGWLAEEQRRGRLRADLDPGRAAAQFAALVRGELFTRVVLGITPDPTDAEIEAGVDAAVDVLLRAWAVTERPMTGGPAGPEV
jgi:TetR/AcrR family transcriptional repressor of mexJK operon